jgi:hypothetical protein
VSQICFWASFGCLLKRSDFSQGVTEAQMACVQGNNMWVAGKHYSLGWAFSGSCIAMYPEQICSDVSKTVLVGDFAAVRVFEDGGGGVCDATGGQNIKVC